MSGVSRPPSPTLWCSLCSQQLWWVSTWHAGNLGLASWGHELNELQASWKVFEVILGGQLQTGDSPHRDPTGSEGGADPENSMSHQDCQDRTNPKGKASLREFQHSFINVVYENCTYKNWIEASGRGRKDPALTDNRFYKFRTLSLYKTVSTFS